MNLFVCLTFEEPRIFPADVQGRKHGLVRHVTGSHRAPRDSRGILVYILFIEGFGVFCTA